MCLNVVHIYIVLSKPSYNAIMFDVFIIGGNNDYISLFNVGGIFSTGLWFLSIYTLSHVVFKYVHVGTHIYLHARVLLQTY